MIKQYGEPMCWGADQRWAELPINNLPPDAVKVRRKIRNKSVAVAYVKTGIDVQRWVLAPDDGGNSVRLAYLQGVNRR